MKKLLLLGFLLPLAAMGQNLETGARKSAIPLFSKPVSPTKIANPKIAAAHGTALNKTVDSVHMETIFNTTFDLQFSSSGSRRIVVHPGGKVSATCNYAGNADLSRSPITWPDRGSNYNFYDGSSGSFNGSLGGRIESKRCGYPCIVSVNDGGVEKDLIISHFASNTVADSSGGFFMEMNNSLGSTSFNETRVHYPFGPLWPRAAVSGDYIHIIGNYFINDSAATDTVVRKGGTHQPLVYYRYRISKHAFDIMDATLPQYDTTRYAVGAGDSYNIDARDSVVAIVAGGTNQDVAVWKSTDNGNSWTKNVIEAFAHAPYYLLTDKDTFGNTHTNDGSNSIIIDQRHIVHVVFAGMVTVNSKAHDKTYSYFPGTDQIIYWNDSAKTELLIGKTPGETALAPVPTLNLKNNGAQYGNNGLSTWPSITVDKGENVYVIWSSPYVSDGSVTSNGLDFRHIMYTYSPDAGKSWFGVDTSRFPINDLSFQALKDTDNNPFEDVFPSLARDFVDSNLYITWQRDPNPRTYIYNGTNGSTTNPDQENQIMFARLPLTFVRSFRFPKTTGIEKLTASNFSMSACYPNPSNSIINIPLNLIKAGEVSVKVTDMLGKEVSTQNYGMMSNGKNLLSLDVRSYTQGLYFYTVKVGNSSLTEKMIVE